LEERVPFLGRRFSPLEGAFPWVRTCCCVSRHRHPCWIVWGYMLGQWGGLGGSNSNGRQEKEEEEEKRTDDDACWLPAAHPLL